MKSFLASLALVLLIVVAPVVVHAQNPVQDTIPQLKEWWRADNMQYGKYGMTWLDNFYNGKGALVVWTPNGVQTWQLRFPGDTQNVFTWQKGSSNIQKGDFNGDGIIDYIDENGNIYQGIKNGELPNPEPIIPIKRFAPWFVGDFNNDGIDDIIDNANPLLFVFGKQSLQEMKVEPFVIKGVDTNNLPLAIYKTNNNELRLVCRHVYWINHTTYPFQEIIKDGLRLIRVWWEGNSFKSEILDEFTADTKDGTGLYWEGSLFPKGQGKDYFICATMISGKNQNTNVTVYDLSNDKIEKLYTKRIDRISASGISVFSHGIDIDTIPSLCIRQYNDLNQPVLHIYNGNISNSLQEIAQFNITEYTNLPLTGLISLPDITGNNKTDIALSNRLIFYILTHKDTSTSVIENENDNMTFSLSVISPQPVLKDKVLQVKVSVSKVGNYSLSLFDRVGKKIMGKTEQYQLTGEQTLSINIEDYRVNSGVYTLQLEGKGKIAQCSIIIQ